MSALAIPSSGEVILEARWDEAAWARGVAVLCHPHPQHGGTMTAPLMEALARHLREEGFDVLRFNFRGVGGSTGRWDGGVAEVDDVGSAVAHAVACRPNLPLGVAGWSFGAATALRWQAREGDGRPFVGVAPPVSGERTPPLPDPETLPPGRRRFVLGDRDQFTSVARLAEYAAAAGAELEVVRGSDHFFYFREQRVAELVAEGLRT